MTIEQVVTETPPFSDIRNEAVVVMRVVRGDRPELAPTLSQSPNMKKLISDCWSENRDSRPTAGYMLSEVEKEYPRGGYTVSLGIRTASFFCSFLRLEWLLISRTCICVIPKSCKSCKSTGLGNLHPHVTAIAQTHTL